MTNTAETYRTRTPYLIVPDADLCHRNQDNTVMHAEVMIGDSMVMLGQAGAQWKPLSAALYLWIDDVDATYKRALAAGARSESEPEDKPYGHRNAAVIDRSGITWWIGAPVKAK